MEKTALFIFIILVLIITPISAQETDYDGIPESFYNSIDTGNYSELEDYLNQEMKNSFNRDKFMEFRESIISEHGDPRGYKFIREEKSDYIRSYYKVEFEESYLTFRLVLTESNGQYKVAGFQITKVEDKENSNQSGLLGGGGLGNLGILFPFLGGLLGFLVFYLLGFKDIKFKELGIGLLLLLLTVFFQPIIQNFPFIILGMNSNASIVARGLGFTILTSLWIGFVAGSFQQIIRYPFAVKRPVKQAIFIGIGFGLSEAIIFPLFSLLPSNAPPTSLSVGLNFLSLAERFFVTIFHGTSTAILSYAYSKDKGFKALLGLIIAHGIIDTFAANYQLTGSKYVLGFSLILTAVISASLLYLTLRRITEDG